EAEQALAGGEDVAEPSLLRDDGAPGGEIGRTPVTEPAGTQDGILLLGDGELASRARDIVAVSVHVVGELRRRTDLPAVALQHLPVVVGVAAQAELESLLSPLRQIDHLHELEVLGPVVRAALELDLAVGLLPVANGGEMRARLAAEWLPQVHDHRLARGAEVELRG